MYNPGDGRFLQTDPIGYDDGLNMYTYCGNDPINWVDQSGLTMDQITEVAPVVAPSGTALVIVIKGAYIGTIGTVATTGAAIVGTAAASGAAGYGIGKYAVCPLIDKIPMDYLYDRFINKDLEEYPYRRKRSPTRKKGKDIARGLGQAKPIHHGPHKPGDKSHWHPTDKNGNKLTGKKNIHIEYPFSFLPFLLLPDDDVERNNVKRCE